MGRVVTLALRVVLAVGIAGSLVVQVVLVPLAARDLSGAGAEVLRLRPALLALAVLGVLTVQVTMVCTWRLATMARRGTVFSRAAFRWIDVVVGAIATASLLCFVLGALLAPGEAVAPGVVLLVGGLGVLAAGVALVVLVMRALLVRAVDRDAEATALQTELDAVI